MCFKTISIYSRFEIYINLFIYQFITFLYPFIHSSIHLPNHPPIHPSFHQLSATEECRKIIKNCNTYIILRELHTWEKDEECKDAAETLISLLIADEPETGMRDLNTVEIPKDIQDDFDKTSKLKNN